MSTYVRKCFCTAPLLPDGTCRFGCDPALRASGKRRGSITRAQRQRENAAKRDKFTPADAACVNVPGTLNDALGKF